MSKVCVLGAGSWGTALAIVLSENNEKVSLWTLNESQVLEVNEKNTNNKYLKDVVIPNNIVATTSIDEAIQDSEMVVLAVPSQAISSVCSKIKGTIRKEQIIVNVAKGLERTTYNRMSEVVLASLGSEFKYSILSGPSHAEEVALGLPTAVVVSSFDEEVMSFVQDKFCTESFRVYTNEDVVGVELGGTLKNIIAFGCGICDGLGYGDNTQSALITRGLNEMKRFGVALNAKEDTFNGLSGTGDLIVTCTSKHSRNRRAGYLVGSGMSLKEAEQKVEMVVEGIVATKAVYSFAKSLGIDMPIVNAIYDIINNGACPREALKRLMNREKKSE